MSFNQSKSDKSETTQYRKSGRTGSFNQHRPSSTTYISKGGAAPSGSAPSPSSAAPSPATSSNRSFKKSNNVQGGQSRMGAPVANYAYLANSSAPRNLQNGAHVQPPLQGAPVASVPNEAAKNTEASPTTQRSNQTVSKPPTGQSASTSSDHPAPKTPAKAPEDSSKAYAFQFGSISPGFMNGMQIPARTSSAPPNLDEQKRDQARSDPHKAAPPVPTPAPKHSVPRKDVNAADHSNNGESHPFPKVKKDAQVSQAQTVSKTQKPPVLPIPMASMQQPFHQQQVPVHFGGPNPQIQPQGVPTSSLQMPVPMPLAMANAQQPLFVQPHQVQPQGIMHQGQMSYTTQMGPRVPPQMGTSQYPQQQGGKFNAPRKAVKITDPKTHEELRLDKRPDAYADAGSAGMRSQPNLPPHSQAIPSFAPSHPMYFRNSYNANNIYFQGPGALPVSSSQMAPGAQPPRFNYPINLGPQNTSFVNQSHHSSPISKSGSVLHASPENTEHGHDVHNVISSAPSAAVQVTTQPSAVSSSVKVADPPLLSGVTATGGKSLYQKATGLPVEVSSSHLQRDSRVPKESSQQQQNLETENLASKPPKVATEQSAAVSGDSMVCHSLSSSSSAQSEELVSGNNSMVSSSLLSSSPARSVESLSGTNAESKPETLSSTNSLKIHPKKPGKEGHVQHQHQDGNQSGTVSTPTAADSQEQVKQIAEQVAVVDKTDNEVSTVETSRKALDESIRCDTKNNRTADKVEASMSQRIDSSNVGKSQGDQVISGTDALSSKNDFADSQEVINAIPETVAPIFTPALTETTLGPGEGVENADGNVVPLAVDLKDKPIELARSKSTTVKLKKKRKEIYQKADALGTTSDLYTAYKGPQDKKEIIAASEITENMSTQAQGSASEVDSAGEGKGEQVKAEPEDWEDAADILTPKLGTSGYIEKAPGQVQHQQDGDGNTAKKYSRDFLLKFSEHCTDLPQGFEITSEIAEAFTTANIPHLVDRDSNASPGRNIDRSSSGSRLDRRISGMSEEERWNKMPGPFGMGRDIHLDVGFGNAAGFRPGQIVNYGNPRNLRPQASLPYVGGILPGPMQSVGPLGGTPRNGPDADRWQRATNFQHRGLIPSPQTPLQMMHKAEKKYEVGKVSDEEEAKQRQLKAILNKLTPQNFEKLFEQVKEVNIDNVTTLTGVISQIFDKALMEPTFCEMYANFCHHLAAELPDFSEDNEKITFKRLLLNKCQEEFERNEREQEAANKTDEEDEVKQTAEEREEKRVKARRRMLGNIRLIGELYKKRMLTERIMHECIKKLLGQYENPDEEDVESLCKLMSTIGEMIDHPRAKEHMDSYFEKMAMLSNNMKLSSRVRFMLKDAIDLRKNKWQQRRKVEGPKKIEEVHRDAAQERHLQTSRLGRNTSMNPSMRRAPMDFGSSGSSMLPSPNAHMSAFQGMNTPVRGHVPHDYRFDERQSFEAKTLRLVGDESITLGPQGGLARGMATRGPPTAATSPVADISFGPGQGDPRRMTTGRNYFSGMSEWPNYSSREDFTQRNVPDRFAVPTAYDQVNAQDHNLNYGSRESRNMDQGFGRSHATSPPQVQEPQFTQNVPSGNVSEEYLRDKSLSAIKEFYSARDEKEVAMCIKELNSPSFHPSMISLWVTDSFERKDMERELLMKLLINLARSGDDILTPAQLVKGFESVLTTLEDAVNDAPKAPEFLGRVFGKAVLENVVSLKEIGRLIREGGEEPGCLLEVGLAGDILGSTLEVIKAEKGVSVVGEFRKSSGLRLEDFRPPDPIKSRILEKFI